MDILKKGYTKDEFSAYLKKEVKPKLKGFFKPVGVVLHNTWAPTLANWPGIVHGKPITVEQRLENIKTGYVARGWTAGPHLFIDKDKIWTFTPLWLRGLHSPSFNSTHWGVELVGNFDVEEFPDSMRDLAEHAIRELYALIGQYPDSKNFKFHRDDPRTTHKACPGKAVGEKADWIKNINAVPAPVKPVAEAPPPKVNPLPVINDESLNLVKRWEAFRAVAYSDGARMAIGYGRNEGHRGFVITPGMEVTEKQASDWLFEDLTEIARKIIPNLTVKANSNQLGAMCSLAYNIGTGAFLKSNVLKFHNEGRLKDAAQAFLRWNKARDATDQLVERKGLTNRRTAEKTLYEKPSADK